MAKKSEKPKENYLKIPNHIRNVSTLGYGAKELLAHIYSFGRNGCWQSNETLGKMFYRSTRTITDWIAKLKKGRRILWVSGKGYYRTLYAKTHPDVKSAQTLVYRGKEIPKSKVISGQTESTQLSRKPPSELEENCQVTSQKSVIPLSRKLPHTINPTMKETTKSTIAPPSPLPAGGQAPALLEDRKKDCVSQFEQLKRKFGRGRRQGARPTQAELDQRRQSQKEALLG